MADLKRLCLRVVDLPRNLALVFEESEFVFIGQTKSKAGSLRALNEFVSQVNLSTKLSDVDVKDGNTRAAGICSSYEKQDGVSSTELLLR